MSTVSRRLIGAALALALLAPAAGAAPATGQPWWLELWEVLSSFRSGAFWSLALPDKAGSTYDPHGQRTASPGEAGSHYDPNGVPPSSLDKVGPDADPSGQPLASPSPSGPGGG